VSIGDSVVDSVLDSTETEIETDDPALLRCTVRSTPRYCYRCWRCMSRMSSHLGRSLIGQAPPKSSAPNGTGTGKRPITIGQSDIISCAN
jgi:hypothetical protein